MKLGFSLLEFVIGMMIGSMLLTQTFIIYNGIAKSAQKTQKYTTIDTQLIITQNRLQTDLNGLCPLWFDKHAIESNQKNNNSAGDAKEPQREEKAEQQATPEQKEKNQPKLFFYAQNKDKNLDYFTFVTTNALQMYGSESSPLIRVIYRLQPNKKQELFKK